MNKLKSLLSILAAAALFGVAFPGCGFEINFEFTPGVAPHTSAMFCDVEKNRRCSTPEDRIAGVDIALPFETGFWLGKSSGIGLDYSPAALAACGGQPQAVEFRGEFPTGDVVCVNPALIPDKYATTNEACKAWCTSHHWIDGDGNEYGCEFIAWRSNGADQLFPNACDAAGTKLPGQDPRSVRVLNPVVWTNVVGVLDNGGNLTKDPNVPEGWGNAGAVSTHTFGAGDGRVQTTVAETDTLRIFGLGNADTSQNFDDLEYGLLLTQAGTLFVVENNALFLNVGTYANGDTLEVAVEGGLVRYKRNAIVLYTSATPPTYPLLVDTAFNYNGGTLQSTLIDF